ncbi:helix-turn-helix domain-containing protein [Streptomyces sp. NPDC005799]|uniref:TetR/AcrR family transcriptional regulator n=1 Tax=Streptomyces sp. NPDC005799 TaxID=3154678 RepID=UPI0033DDED13
MARWEPNARERLERAALALFVERGYDATTVAEIADRAGLTKSTFFRHFADKREVVFGGRDQLADRFAEVIRGASPETTVAGCLTAALESVARVFTPERQDLARQRRAVTTAHSELRERELLKLARLSEAIGAALRDRGVDDTTSRLAAEMGVLAFTTAFARWTEPGNERPYTEIAHTALRDLRDRAAALGTEAEVSA